MTMYNEEYKMNYIKETEFRNNFANININLLFRKIAPYEEKIGSDLYDFSVVEIIDYYKSLCTPSLESLMIMNNQYKLYTAYSLMKGMVKDNQNHFDEIDNVILNSCVNYGLISSKIVTRKELLDIIEGGYVENVSDKFLALAIFEGICGKGCCELINLTMDDFDGNLVHLSTGRTLEVSDKLVSLAKESAITFDYYDTNYDRNNKSYMIGDRRIIKRMANSVTDDPVRLQRAIGRRLDRLIDKTMSQAFEVKALIDSGRIEMTKDIMKDGKSLRDALNDEKVVKRYGKLSSIPRFVLKYGLTED